MTPSTSSSPSPSLTPSPSCSYCLSIYRGRHVRSDHTVSSLGGHFTSSAWWRSGSSSKFFSTHQDLLKSYFIILMRTPQSTGLFPGVSPQVGKILIGETERFSQLEDDHEGAQVRRGIFLASGSTSHFQVNDCPLTRDQDYGYFYENGLPTPACGSVSLPIDRCYR